MSFPEPDRSHRGPRHTPYGSTYDTRPQPVVPPAGAPAYDEGASSDGASAYGPTYAPPRQATPFYEAPPSAPSEESRVGRPRFGAPGYTAAQPESAPFDAPLRGSAASAPFPGDPFGAGVAYDPRREGVNAAGRGGARGRRTKRRHFIGYPLVAILGLGIGATIGGGDAPATRLAGAQAPAAAATPAATAAPAASATPAGGAEPTAPTAPKSTTPGVGDTVRDGTFAFTVTKVKKGVTSVGDDMLGKKAQGRFVLVSVTVKNIGDTPQSLSGEAQQLFTAAGKEYSADTEAGFYLDGANSLYEEINPGNSLKGVIVFDLPTDAKVSRIELHDSLFSDGVDVSLT